MKEDDIFKHIFNLHKSKDYHLIDEYIIESIEKDLHFEKYVFLLICTCNLKTVLNCRDKLYNKAILAGQKIDKKKNVIKSIKHLK